MTSAIPVVAPDGRTMIEYLGGNVGVMTWYGAVTGKKYEAGGTKRIVTVDNRDLVTGISRKPGFLEMRDGGQRVFRKYNPDGTLIDVPTQMAQAVNPSPPQVAPTHPPSEQDAPAIEVLDAPAETPAEQPAKPARKPRGKNSQ